MTFLAGALIAIGARRAEDAKPCPCPCHKTGDPLKCPSRLCCWGRHLCGSQNDPRIEAALAKPADLTAHSPS